MVSSEICPPRASQVLQTALRAWGQAQDLSPAPPVLHTALELRIPHCRCCPASQDSLGAHCTSKTLSSDAHHGQLTAGQPWTVMSFISHYLQFYRKRSVVASPHSGCVVNRPAPAGGGRGVTGSSGPVTSHHPAPPAATVLGAPMITLTL